MNLRAARIGAPFAHSLLVLALAVVSMPGQASTAVIPPDAVLVDAHDAGVFLAAAREDVDRTIAMIAAGDPDAALAKMRAHADPQRFEPLAAEVIARLLSTPEDAASNYLLEALSQEPVRLFKRHDETAADWFVPVFDIGASARSALALRAFVRERDAQVRALRSDPEAALGKADTQPAALAAAIPMLERDALERVARVALGTKSDIASPVWTALARALPEPSLLEASALQAEPVDLLPLIQELTPKLSPARALAWLDAVVGRPELASSAVLAVGTLAPESDPAMQWLAKHLGRTHTGASAAAAFARMPQVGRVERIDALLQSATDKAVVSDLVLALRLEGSPAALAQLDRMRDDPRLHDTARTELQR